jgi:hypothetical protein
LTVENLLGETHEQDDTVSLIFCYKVEKAGYMNNLHWITGKFQRNSLPIQVFGYDDIVPYRRIKEYLDLRDLTIEPEVIISI